MSAATAPTTAANQNPIPTKMPMAAVTQIEAAVVRPRTVRLGSQELHQFQSAAIRTEAALIAGASGRKPVLYPAAGDSLWRKRVAGHTPCRRAPCIADLLAMRETPPDHRSRAQSAPAAACPHRATGQSPRHPCCSDP